MEPSNQELQKNRKRFPKWGWWVVGIVGVLALIGGGYWIGTRADKSTPTPSSVTTKSKSSTTSKSVAKDNLLIIYGLDSGGQRTLVKYNPADQSKSELANINDGAKGNEPDYYQLSGNDLYYRNNVGTLSKINLVSKSNTKVEIAGVSARTNSNSASYSESINSILLANDKLYFLRGGCGEGLSCDLGVYDIVSGKSEILIEDADGQFKNMGNDGMSLFSYDKSTNAVLVEHSSGDGPYGETNIYSVNVNSKVVTLKDSASYFYCGSGENGKCTAEEEAGNAKFDKISKLPAGSCGDNKVVQDYTNNRYIIQVNEAEVNIGGSKDNVIYVGCVE